MAHRSRQMAASPQSLGMCLFRLFTVLALLVSNLGLADEDHCRPQFKFRTSQPAEKKYDIQKLIDLSNWVMNSPVPIFSVTLSKGGDVFYEIYTSGIKRDDAHYVMSVSKSVTSALVGIAIDHGFIKGIDEVLTDMPLIKQVTARILMKFYPRA